MTTLLAAPSVESTQLRPIPCSALAKATWLRHRGLLVVIAVCFVGFALAILFGEWGIHASYASYLANGCVGSLHVPCGSIANRMGTGAFNALIIALHVMPVFVGVFVGAPLLSRELESGSFRFTWTQAASRRRQLFLTVLLLGLAVALGSCLLGLLINSYAHPFEVLGEQNHWVSRLFEDSPVVLPAWSMLALIVGVFVGALIGRTVPAMAATAALLGAAVAFSYELLRCMLLIAPTVISGGAPTSDVGVLNMPSFPGFGPANTWLVRAWFTGPRKRVLTESQAINLTDHMNQVGAFPSGTSAGTGPEKWLSAHHYVFSLAYQPAGHYWLFQGFETVILLAVLAAFVGATSWVVRRRSS